MLKGNQKQLLSEFISDSYGTPEELAKCLDLGIEMFFYLEKDSFEQKDIQNVVFAIRGIIGILRHSD